MHRDSHYDVVSLNARTQHRVGVANERAFMWDRESMVTRSTSNAQTMRSELPFVAVVWRAGAPPSVPTLTLKECSGCAWRTGNRAATGNVTRNSPWTGVFWPNVNLAQLQSMKDAVRRKLQSPAGNETFR